MEARTDGQHKLIGSAMMKLAGDGQFIGVTGKLGSLVKCVKFQLKPNVSFIDYVFGGCQIALTVAIDYTGSNGPQSNP